MAKNMHQRNSAAKEVKEFEEEVLQIDRVTRVVKGGRRLRFRATVVIGDKKGRVGVGVGKSEEVVGAIQKAISDGKKNLITVKLNGATIPHEIQVKYKSAKILIMPAAPGTGIIAGGSIRRVVGLAGIKDILSKSFGTTNKIACSRATLLALSKLRETPFMKKRVNVAPQPKQEKQPEKQAEKQAEKPTDKPSKKQPTKKPLNVTTTQS